MADARSERNAAHVAVEARRHDPGRVLCAQFAAPEKRPHLLALYALNGEVSRIPASVSQPLLGRIKLQWWRDTLDALAGGASPPVGHPVAEAVALVMRSRSLDRSAFEPLLALREKQLDAGDADSQEIDADACGVDVTLASLALTVLGITDATTMRAACEAAIAYGLAEIVRRARSDPAQSDLHVALAARAQEHLAAARRMHGQIERRALPVLLWATIAETRLRATPGPYSAVPPVPKLIWNAWRGRY